MAWIGTDIGSLRCRPGNRLVVIERRGEHAFAARQTGQAQLQVMHAFGGNSAPDPVVTPARIVVAGHCANAVQYREHRCVGLARQAKLERVDRFTRTRARKSPAVLDMLLSKVPCMWLCLG